MLQLALTVLALQALLLLLIRPLLLWYLQISRRTRALEDIAESLRTLPAVRQYDHRSERGHWRPTG
jgi:hypothetical protein